MNTNAPGKNRGLFCHPSGMPEENRAGIMYTPLTVRIPSSRILRLMEILPYIVPFVWIVVLESATVRWIAGGQVPSLLSRVFATNLAGAALLMFIAMTGWLLGWWPDIRNWALRDSFFLFLIIKAPIFGFLFRRWGIQRIFTLHVLSNFASIIVVSLLFVYAPWMLAVRPLDREFFNELAVHRVKQIEAAVESYRVAHGYYPNYVWGGDLMSWGSTRTPDPLLSEGYLQIYPVNPLNLRRSFFVPRREPGWRELWFGFKSDEFLKVRSLWEPIVLADPRFGYRGAKMGNVLPDPRMPETKLPDDTRFTRGGEWLPGGFFYRSYDLDENGFADAYILGVCGDEASLATVDCYDAVNDTLTREIDGMIIPFTNDLRRDGVIYLRRRGFPRQTRPAIDEDVPPIRVPVVPGENSSIPQFFPTEDSLSAGMDEPRVDAPEGEDESGDVE